MENKQKVSKKRLLTEQTEFSSRETKAKNTAHKSNKMSLGNFGDAKNLIGFLNDELLKEFKQNVGF